MSSIGPNLLGSVLQSQVSANQTARSSDAQNNKRAEDSRKLRQTADRKQHEVENTDHAENLTVHRPDERDSDDQPRHYPEEPDTYEPDTSPDSPPPPSDAGPTPDPDDTTPPPLIDLSA